MIKRFLMSQGLILVLAVIAAMAAIVVSLVGCASAEEICPDMAREEFAGRKSILGIKIEQNNSMVLLHEESVTTSGFTLRAYLCHQPDGAWKIVPAGVIQIEPKTAEKGTP